MNTVEQNKTKFMKNEVAAFEARLAHIKVELDAARKDKEKVTQESEDIKVRSNQDVDAKRFAIRKEQADLDEAKRKFSSDKDEFTNILNDFRREKTAFEKEKQISIDIKKDAEKSLEQVGIFIRMVRDGASKL